MALSLSGTMVEEKNKLMSEGAWLVLLEIQFQGGTIHLVRNTEKITWNEQEWRPFPFELDDISEGSKGEIPSLKIKVNNVNRQMQKYVDELDGGIGAVAIIRVVHSDHLDIYEPDLEVEFNVESTDVDHNWVTFTLGADSTNATRYPNRRIIKDFCPFKFKGIECAYVGDAVICSKTLSGCRARNNAVRFGGEASIPVKGFYVSNM